jgi:hypothetical protein
MAGKETCISGSRRKRGPAEKAEDAGETKSTRITRKEKMCESEEETGQAGKVAEPRSTRITRKAGMPEWLEREKGQAGKELKANVARKMHESLKDRKDRQQE